MLRRFLLRCSWTSSAMTNLPNDQINQDYGNLNDNIGLNLMNPIYGDYFNDFENEFGINCVFSSEQGIVQKLKTFNENLLNIFSINCQSLHSKYNDIVSTVDFFRQHDIHLNVLCFQELWLNKDVNMDCYGINNYDWHIKFRIMWRTPLLTSTTTPSSMPSTQTTWFRPPPMH